MGTAKKVLRNNRYLISASRDLSILAKFPSTDLKKAAFFLKAVNPESPLLEHSFNWYLINQFHNLLIYNELSETNSTHILH